MAKTKISEFDSTPANNTDIDGINIAEGCAPSGINNAIRELMSQLKNQQTGADGDNFTIGGNLSVTGTSTFTGATTFTGAVVMSTALPVASGGTGASTAGNARTNLSAAASGANSDITSITGLTTALTVAQGGTGSATLTANNVLLGNGTSALQAVAPSTAGKVLVSNGTTWTSNTIAASGIKLGLGITGEVWNDVTSSRSSGTTYTNSNAYPIMVNIQETSNAIATLFVSGVQVGQVNMTGGDATMSAIVPAGATYIAAGGIGFWSELY
jgi:hypothetical protein